METRSAKKIKNCADANARYHRLSESEKKELNKKRAQQQKRKRQRNKEIAELEAVLRQTNDIVDDSQTVEQLSEQKMRTKWTEFENLRYQRMSSEERDAYNDKHRMCQIIVKNENDEIVDVKEIVKNENDEIIDVKENVKEDVKAHNLRKALSARARYHQMTPDEKKLYNQRRSEAIKRQRLENEALLATPIELINDEIFERVQNVIARNAKRSENARLRYQRMTPEERKEYNRKRSSYYKKKNVKMEQE
uniref:Uncharacterized protein n=1 Tax=Panagrolaimus superbus TaxID=310955 RepID=A0A914YEY2_9BILA